MLAQLIPRLHFIPGLKNWFEKLVPKLYLGTHYPARLRVASFPDSCQVVVSRRRGKPPRPPGESRRPHHDRATCPLCQATLGQVKYAITSPPTILSCTLARQDFCPQKPDSCFFSADYLLIASRAPPTCPLT